MTGLVTIGSFAAATDKQSDIFTGIFVSSSSAASYRHFSIAQHKLADRRSRGRGPYRHPSDSQQGAGTQALPNRSVKTE